MTFLYGIIAIVGICGIISFGVELGRVQLAKTELQRAADAAARYAAAGLSQGVTVVQDRAVTAASENAADGASVVLDTNADIEFGTWSKSSQTFTVLTGPDRANANSVRITARRTAARGNAVPLIFGGVVGRSSVDISAVSVASRNDITSAFIALSSFSVTNNLFAASYNSSVNPNPTQSNHSSNGMLGSNGSITAKNNEVVGLLYLGPNGTTNLDLDSDPIVIGQDIPAPTIDFSGAPGTNPGGLSQTLSVTGTRTLAGGTYYFTSITMGNNSTLTFSGPATVYVDGDVTFSNTGTITAYDSIPGNLKIRQRGANSKFGGSNANNVILNADIEAPQTDFEAKNNVVVYGRAIFETFHADNNAEFYYDEALQTTVSGVAEGGTITMVR